VDVAKGKALYRALLNSATADDDALLLQANLGSGARAGTSIGAAPGADTPEPAPTGRLPRSRRIPAR
jgi:hypothetical protein